MQGVSKKELHNGIPNVTVRRVLRKRLHLKACKLSIVQRSSANVFVTLVTLQHLEYRCEALFFLNTLYKKFPIRLHDVVLN
jgi:hypothetical protein